MEQVFLLTDRKSFTMPQPTTRSANEQPQKLLELILLELLMWRKCKQI